MSLWAKLFGAGARGEGAPSGTARVPTVIAPSPGAPSIMTAIPGKLTVAFYAHDTVEGSQGNFLSAVSRGFLRYGQDEIVLTLRLAAGDPAIAKMPDITRFFASVHAWASQRQLTIAGGLTQFGERGLFERSHSGILYGDASPIAGVDIPPRALAAIVVDAAEVRTAVDYGAYRVLTRIGERYRHFPFPPWSDLDRPSVASARENESALAKVVRARAHGASFVVEDERVRIRLPPSARQTLGRGIGSLSPGAPFALLLRPAADANAVLFWYPGQSEAAGISPHGSDGSRTSGSCLVVVPGGQDDQIRVLEDGYSLLFSSKSWALLSAALFEQRPISLRMADGITLSLEWLPD